LGLKHLEFVIKTEKNVIQMTEDTQLMNIISTTPQAPILIFHTMAWPFSSYTFPEASNLFNLKVNSMGECPVYHQGMADLVGMDRYINETVWDLMCLHRAYALGLKHLEFVIKTEKNVIQMTEDTQLMNIISTTPQAPILIFHTMAWPFSSYTFPEASNLFNLKVNSMGECPVYHQGMADLVGMDRYINETVWDLMCLHRAYGDVSGTNKALYSVFIRAVLVGIIHTYNPADNYLLLEQKVIMGSYGMRPVDFAIKKGNQFIGITEAKKEAISKGFAQNLIQLLLIWSENQKRKDNEETDGLQVLFGIDSTGSQWFFHRLIHEPNKKYPIVQRSSLSPINLSVIGHEFDKK
ncbi:1228_t:CDS:2, partial [Entrophospora sp. SA101]